MGELERVVISGVGLTSPNGNSIGEFRRNLLRGVSGVTSIETRFMGRVLAGVCNVDEFRYQSKKERRRGTRAGSLSIFAAHEALLSAGLTTTDLDPARVGKNYDSIATGINSTAIWTGYGVSQWRSGFDESVSRSFSWEGRVQAIVHSVGEDG